jgi:hypothetical protein
METIYESINKSMDKEIVVYIQARNIIQVLKKMMQYVTKRVNLEDIMLSQISQTEKYYIISFIYGNLKTKNHSNREYNTSYQSVELEEIGSSWKRVKHSN